MALFVRTCTVALFATFVVAIAAPARAEDAPPLPKEAVDYFEAKVRPVLLDKCYHCHDGSGAQAVKGGLTLDTPDGLLTAGSRPAPARGCPRAANQASPRSCRAGRRTAA